MKKATNEDIKVIEDKLNFIGLDLDKLPKFITEYTTIQYKPTRYYNEKSYQVYRYVDIEDIEILLTPTNRLNSIQEKYSMATSLYSYLTPKDDEGILRHTIFLKMLKEFSIEEVKKIEKEQEELTKNIPYKVKFKDNYLWQIYYSEEDKKYFMLVTTQDLDYSGFFYLLKKKFECAKTGKSKKIYVPVNNQDYSNEYLKRSEFADIEKYLWLFTKDWPLTYEVYDTSDQLSIQIIGQTNIYEKIKSYYRIKLNSKEEANEFYKLAKALFILQTELPQYYKFNTRINQYGNFEFEYKDKKIDYSKLADMIKKEANKNKKETQRILKEKETLQEKLQELKEVVISQETEYRQKERQIAMYLECRKTFFGKVKYFLQTRKGKKIKKVEQEIETNKEEKNQIEIAQNIEFIEKENYTIEDLINICKQLDTVVTEVKKLKLDLNAVENKIENMKLKIKNATLYIEEIDSHEKSIFEFWKFANKDENLMLVQGIETNEQQTNKISKVFDYEEDIEEFGEQIDKIQRNLYNKQYTDSIYVMSTKQRDVVNYIDKIKESSKKEVGKKGLGNYENEDLKEAILQTGLEELKAQAEEERILFQKENFDIFGGILEDSTKIKLIGSKKHRETAKDIIQILDINKNTKLEEYKQNLTKQKENFKEALTKSKAPINMEIFIQNGEESLEGAVEKAHINPKKAIDEVNSKKVYLHKINIKKGDNIIYLSNIIFYENNNKTLPLGMDLSDGALIDLKNKQLNIKEEKSFRIVEEKDENKMEIKQVIVKEYEILKKKEEVINDK